jgi:hypothetical protein
MSKLCVLHTAHMETMVGMFRAMGIKFTPEKHGSGPDHYAFEANGHIFEIYPQKNNVEAVTVFNHD